MRIDVSLSHSWMSCRIELLYQHQVRDRRKEIAVLCVFLLFYLLMGFRAYKNIKLENNACTRRICWGKDELFPDILFQLRWGRSKMGV